MSLPTLAATAAAALLAVVGLAGPRDDGDLPVRSLAHVDERPSHGVPAKRMYLASAPVGEPHGTQRAGRGGHGHRGIVPTLIIASELGAPPEFADFPKMKG